jgi:hypothetical protein
MRYTCIPIPKKVTKLRRRHLAKVFWPCIVICSIAFAFPPATGDVIEAVPGQSIDGQLDLIVNELSGYHITITPPRDISEWQLRPDETNQITATFKIWANKDGWQLTAKDSDTTTSGHMTEWTGAGYSSLKLANPMRVKAASEVSLPDGGVIQTGDKSNNIQGQNIEITFLQNVTFADEILPEGHVYRIVITFTGSYIQ